MQVVRVAQLIRQTLTDRSEVWNVELYFKHESHKRDEIECYSRDHAERLLEALHSCSNTEVHYSPEYR